jgi:hypothetical protein
MRAPDGHAAAARRFAGPFRRRPAAAHDTFIAHALFAP